MAIKDKDPAAARFLPIPSSSGVVVAGAPHMRTRLSSVLAATALLAVLPSPAVAAPVSYRMQIGSRGSDAIALDGDQLVKFQTTAAPTSCPDGHEISSDDAFDIKLAGPLQLSEGKFQFSGRAPPSYYPTWDPSQGADYTVTGSVRRDNEVITGTIEISNATDPFIRGCSGSARFIAIPSVPYTGRGPANPKADFNSQFVNFNYRGGVVQHLRLQANFVCGQSIDSAVVFARDYGFDNIHASSSGAWKMHAYVLDEYGSIVLLDVSGRISGRTARGRIVTSEPPGLSGVSGERCGGTNRWTASRPVPPAPPGPEAFFEWEAVRVAAGAAYRYYFVAEFIECRNGANAIRITIAGRPHTVSCSQGLGWASGPLNPGRYYTARTSALVVKHARVVKHGPVFTEVIRMPAAGDSWIRIKVNSLPPPPKS